MLSRLVHEPERDDAVSTPQISPSRAKGEGGGILDDEHSESRVSPHLRGKCFSFGSVFRSGCFSQGSGKGGRDIFLSHHAPAVGPKLAQGVGQFLQG